MRFMDANEQREVQNPINVRESSSSSDNFPMGLKVLLVDDNITCLRVAEMMLLKCSYHVTACTEPKGALSLLRDNEESFDVVLTEIHLPEMDGFKLVEIIAIQMDIPVVILSIDSDDDSIKRGLKHGACDYLVKPACMVMFRNIWQHAVRKREGLDPFKRVKTDGGKATIVPNKNHHGKNRENDGKESHGDEIPTKKLRMTWTPVLHQKFLDAVNHLGIDKAVPRKILDLMDVPHLTRDHVGSHLQKLRDGLKKLKKAGDAAQIPEDMMDALTAEMLGKTTNRRVQNTSSSIAEQLLEGPPHAVNLQTYHSFQGAVNHQIVMNPNFCQPDLSTMNRSSVSIPPNSSATDHTPSMDSCSTPPSVSSQMLNISPSLDMDAFEANQVGGASANNHKDVEDAMEEDFLATLLKSSEEDDGL